MCEFRQGFFASIGFACAIKESRHGLGNVMQCDARALEPSRHHRSSFFSLFKAKEGIIRLHLQVQGEVAVATSRGRGSMQRRAHKSIREQPHSREVQKRPKKKTLLYGMSCTSLSQLGTTLSLHCIEFRRISSEPRRKSCRDTRYWWKNLRFHYREYLMRSRSIQGQIYYIEVKYITSTVVASVM